MMDTPLAAASSIDRLPAEILTDIFLCLSFDWSPHPPNALSSNGEYEEWPEQWRQNTRSLVLVTHVCSRWRTAALNTPHLWTHIDDIVPARMVAFAERSSRLPIVAAWQICNKATSPFFIDTIAPRLRRLDILLFEIPIQEVYTKLYMPRLEVLSVALPWLGSVPLEYSAPALKALAITGSHSTWSFPGTFPSLTHLRLDCSGFHPEHIVGFVDFLSRSPTLEAIHIHSLALDEPGDAPSTSIALPRLRTLWITTDYLSDAQVLLTCLVLPSSSRVLLRSAASFGRAFANPNAHALQKFPGLTHLSLVCINDELLACARGVTDGGAQLQVIYQDTTDADDWWAGYLDLSRVETLRLALTRWDALVSLALRAPRLKTLALALPSRAPDAEAHADADADADVDADSDAGADLADLFRALSIAVYPGGAETASIQGARLLDAPDATLQGFLAGRPPGVSVVLDPESADDPRTQAWLLRFGETAHVTASVGAGLYRWDPAEVFWEADRALQERYWIIHPSEDPGMEFVW